jgi:ATP/maltotriose-dependent transcriptional regulator MalT
MGGKTNDNFQRLDEIQLENDTKLYLLMRLVFDLPEAVPASTNQIVVFGYWSGRWLKENGEINSDGTFNRAWPIRWNHGHPNLLAGWVGLEGVNTRYDAAAEFSYCLTNYPMRDLKRFGME